MDGACKPRHPQQLLPKCGLPCSDWLGQRAMKTEGRCSLQRCLARCTQSTSLLTTNMFVSTVGLSLWAQPVTRSDILKTNTHGYDRKKNRFQSEAESATKPLQLTLWKATTISPINSAKTLLDTTLAVPAPLVSDTTEQPNNQDCKRKTHATPPPIEVFFFKPHVKLN